MQIFNNEITCYTGEAFNLNFKLQNKDGSPYVVPKHIDNAGNELPSYFVFSVASSVYNSTESQVFHYWMCYDDVNQEVIPRFKFTDIIDASQLLGGTSAESIPVPNHQNVYGFPGLDWNSETEEGTIYELTDYLYSYTDNNGKKRYVYFLTNEQVVFASGNREYNGTNLQFAFTSEITKQWGAQSYVYDLCIISCNDTQNGYPKYDDITRKIVIIGPTKFKVLYDINKKGGVNIDGDN